MILPKLCMHDKIIKTQIFHNGKFDLKGHWSIKPFLYVFKIWSYQNFVLIWHKFFTKSSLTLNVIGGHMRSLFQSFHLIIRFKIDECLFERSLSSRAVCEGSCYNKLEIQNQPTAIMTNRNTYTFKSLHLYNVLV
jgi:hypothetical protein